MRRMEAKGGVKVTQKDQIATGDSADYDVRANTITLNGNVVVTRGEDVLRGSRSCRPYLRRLEGRRRCWRAS